MEGLQIISGNASPRREGDEAGPQVARPISRQTVDLSAYPDLIVIYLGMRVHTPAGIGTLATFIVRIGQVLRHPPEGLLHSETFLFSLRQIGLRQYWRDFDSLERWARSSVHKEWWRAFLRNPAGTGFWHELYHMKGGMEAAYDNMPATPVGFMNFAPIVPMRGPMFTARDRLGLGGTPTEAVPVDEAQMYDGGQQSTGR